VLTDLGVSTPHVEASLDGCDALVLECNPDPTMLANGHYPYPLKQRIAGRFGHLDNDAAAGILGSIDASRLKHLIAAHLSKQNNTPDLARAALAAALGCGKDWISVADQALGFDWREI
jgi:phosphoribosyl 1,2-cyclic phosphodiesterase